jgi:hypothetical protein
MYNAFYRRIPSEVRDEVSRSNSGRPCGLAPGHLPSEVRESSPEPPKVPIGWGHARARKALIFQQWEKRAMSGTTSTSPGTRKRSGPRRTNLVPSGRHYGADHCRADGALCLRAKRSGPRPENAPLPHEVATRGMTPPRSRGHDIPFGGTSLRRDMAAGRIYISSPEVFFYVQTIYANAICRVTY